MQFVRTLLGQFRGIRESEGDIEIAVRWPLQTR
jgi:hypothetical protein